MGGVLVGLSFMDPSRSRRFLVFSIAEPSQQDPLDERVENLGWVVDRGIPTEEILQTMRASDPPIHYLVGTCPRGS